MAGSRFEPGSNSCSEPPGLNKPEPPLGCSGTENTGLRRSLKSSGPNNWPI